MSKSKLFSIAMESEEPVVSEEEVVSIETLELVEDFLDITTESRELEELNETLEEAEVAYEALSDIVTSNEALIANEEDPKGLDVTSAAVQNISIEHLYDTLGIPHDGSILSVESFEEDAVAATKLSTEGVKETLKKIWTAILKVIKKITEKVVAFVKKTAAKMAPLEAMAKGVVEKAKKLEEEKYVLKEDVFENDALVGKFAAILATTNMKEVDETVATTTAMTVEDSISAIQDTADTVMKVNRSFKGNESVEVKLQTKDSVVAKIIDGAKLEVMGQKITSENAAGLAYTGRGIKVMYAVPADEETLKKEAAATGMTPANVSYVGITGIDLKAPKGTKIKTAKLKEIEDIALMVAELSARAKQVIPEEAKAVSKAQDSVKEIAKAAEKLDGKEAAKAKYIAKLASKLNSTFASGVGIIAMARVSSLMAALSFCKASLGQYSKPEASTEDETVETKETEEKKDEVSNESKETVETKETEEKKD